MFIIDVCLYDYVGKERERGEEEERDRNSERERERAKDALNLFPFYVMSTQWLQFSSFGEGLFLVRIMERVHNFTYPGFGE
jgi:hypothetical protein